MIFATAVFSLVFSFASIVSAKVDSEYHFDVLMDHGLQDKCAHKGQNKDTKVKFAQSTAENLEIEARIRVCHAGGYFSMNMPIKLPKKLLSEPLNIVEKNKAIEIETALDMFIVFGSPLKEKGKQRLVLDSVDADGQWAVYNIFWQTLKGRNIFGPVRFKVINLDLAEGRISGFAKGKHAPIESVYFTHPISQFTVDAKIKTISLEQ